MPTSKFLELPNLRRVKDALVDIVDQSALDAIEREIENNVQQLYLLALLHYKFAIKQPNYHWRQKISRLYYASYAASKAVRFLASGVISADVTDHKKIGDLPTDFRGHARFKNKLDVLRVDRNTCDYDHSATVGDLVNGPKEASFFVEEFIQEANNYLCNRGLVLKGKL